MGGDSHRRLDDARVAVGAADRSEPRRSHQIAVALVASTTIAAPISTMPSARVVPVLGVDVRTPSSSTRGGRVGSLIAPKTLAETIRVVKATGFAALRTRRRVDRACSAMRRRVDRRFAWLPPPQPI